MGLDPYDFVWSYSKLPIPLHPEVIYYLADGHLGFCLTDSRIIQHLLGLFPHSEAKALAVFARSYLSLPDDKLVDKRLAISRLLCDRIWSLRNRQTEMPSWGLSFPWRVSRSVVLPANSPTALITALAGLAFLELYRASDDQTYLNYATKAGSYLINELGHTAYPDDSLCFLYSPVTKKNVINASAVAACFLSSVGRETGDSEVLDMADRAYALLLETQTTFGGWNYFADSKPESRLFDNYHNGFILEAMLRYRGKKVREVEKAGRRGIAFYTRMFDVNGASVFNLAKRYPIDIHDIAQGMLVFSLSQQRFGVGISDALKIWGFAKKHLLKDDGTFASRIYGLGRSTASYPRWADSWMMIGMVELLRALDDSEPWNLNVD